MRVETVPDNWREFRPEGDCLLIRYGAIGDMIQASSVIRALADEGHSVTLNTTPKGWNIVRRDPHISGAILQETNQISQKELREYWFHLGRGFNRVVNLSESVERSIVATAGDRAWSWPKTFRELLMGVDYLAAQHAMAGVDPVFKPDFYPTAEERGWAHKYRKKISGPVVVWALSGSGVNKSYPYTDHVVAALMLGTNATVVFVGDLVCQLLESGWAKEPRVKCASGRWPIRKALAFTQIADIVVGPDTGVINSVGYRQMPKILLLTHNSHKNFSWENTVYLAPENCDCHPCHKLHSGFSTCRQDPGTGAALCAAKIDPSRVYDAIRSAIK